MNNYKDLMEEKLRIEFEVNKKAAELLNWFEESKVLDEITSGWYCGVSGQEKTKNEFERERIGQYYNENFPKLDIDSISHVTVSSITIAVLLEKYMCMKHKFDIGDIQNEPKENEQLFVYIFRKKI